LSATTIWYACGEWVYKERNEMTHLQLMYAKKKARDCEQRNGEKPSMYYGDILD
jgi:hypothetical protein